MPNEYQRGKSHRQESLSWHLLSSHIIVKCAMHGIPEICQESHKEDLVYGKATQAYKSIILVRRHAVYAIRSSRQRRLRSYLFKNQALSDRREFSTLSVQTIGQVIKHSLLLSQLVSAEQSMFFFKMRYIFKQLVPRLSISFPHSLASILLQCSLGLSKPKQCIWCGFPLRKPGPSRS